MESLENFTSTFLGNGWRDDCHSFQTTIARLQGLSFVISTSSCWGKKRSLKRLNVWTLFKTSLWQQKVHLHQ